MTDKAVAEIKGREVHISFPYDAGMVGKVKSLPTRRWDPSLTVWKVPLSDIQLLLKVFPDINFDIGEQTINYEKIIIPEITEPLDDLSYVTYIPKSFPYPFQQAGALKLATSPYFALFDEMGTGKTRQVLDAFGMMNCAGRVKRMLVICPNRLLPNWEEEVAKHSPFSFSILGRDVAKWSDIPLIHAINYEKVIIPEITEALKKCRYDIIVLDEAHRIKDTRTKMSRAVNEIESPYRWMLTGTPYSNGYEDIQPIGDWLGGVFGGRANFIRRYCVTKEVQYPGARYPAHEIVGYMNKAELFSRVGAFSLRRRKADVLPELPAKTFQSVYCPMVTMQENLYNKVRNEAEEIIGEKPFGKISINVLAKITRLLQISSTPATLGYKDNSGKLDAVVEMIGEILLQNDDGDGIGRHAIVIWSHFIPVLEALQKRLAIHKPAILHGGVKDFESEKMRFTSSGTKVLLANPQLAGEGLNLHVADYELMTDCSYSYLDYVQAVDRCHRISQKRPLTIYNFISTYGDGTPTIDAHLFGTLVRKSEMAGEANDDPTPVIATMDGEELLRVLRSKKTYKKDG